MATADVFEGGRCKTILIYRDGDGIALERIDRTRANRRTSMKLTAEELDGILEAWPRLKERLSNAGARSAAGSTSSRPAYKASQAPDSLRSSPEQGSLV